MIKCAFDKDEICIALREKSCLNCSFYKSENNLKEGRRKAEDRLERLPLDIKTRIFRTYNKGSVNYECYE